MIKVYKSSSSWGNYLVFIALVISGPYVLVFVTDHSDMFDKKPVKQGLSSALLRHTSDAFAAHGRINHNLLPQGGSGVFPEKYVNVTTADAADPFHKSPTNRHGIDSRV